MKATAEEITDHIGGEGSVKTAWLEANAHKFNSDAEREAAWVEHWRKVQNFLERLAATTEPIFFPERRAR